MHRIRRQILELTLPRERDAARQAQETGRLFQEQVLPRLDAVFSRIAPDGRILRIPRIAIDLGAIPENAYETEFIERCVRHVVQQVEAAAFEVGADGKPEGAEFADPEENAMAVLMYFLERGTLPWHAAGTSLRTIEEQVAKALKKRTQPGHAVSLRSLLQSRIAAQRLAWQFSWDFILQLLETVAGLSTGSAGRYLKKSEQTPADFSTRQKATFIAVAAQLSERHSGKTLIEAAVAAVFPRQKAPYINTLPKNSQSNAAPDGAPAKNSQAREGEVSQARDGAARRPGAAIRNREGGAIRAGESRQAGNGEPRQAGNRQAIPDEHASAISAEGIAVISAGLVLLAPYLPRFFESLDVEINPARPETTHRALHLLHHLAGSAPNPEEPALAVPKVLCGLLPEEPAPKEFILSASDREECRNLLEAVIRNWPVLKNTSPAGLQGAFLQRGGLLYWKPERQAWLLRVEQQSHDILLERLPWGYGVVKAPWMEWMVQVEW